MKSIKRISCIVTMIVLASLFLTACGVPAEWISSLSDSGNAQSVIPQATDPLDEAVVEPGQSIVDTPAILLFGIGIHVEPFGAEVSALVPGNPADKSKQDPDYSKHVDFQKLVDQIITQVGMINDAGGRATIQLQTPFTTMAISTGATVLSDLAAAGNELALHFHEDAHLGNNSENLPVATWCAVMQEEIGYIQQASGVDSIRYWSGGNLYPQVMEAADCAGLDIYGDWKNPREQTTPAEFTSLSPWRPAGGTDGTDTSLFIQNDPDKAVVYLPEGLVYRTNDTSKHEMVARGGDAAYMDYLADALQGSIDAMDPGKVNVFHITIHPGEYKGDPAEPYAVLDDFLVNVVQPLVAQGRIQWATYSEMADAYSNWEAGLAGLGSGASNSITPASQAFSGSERTFIEQDVTYCTSGGIELKMDIYRPEDAGGILPALLYIHGGAWQKGDKSAAQDQPFVQALVSAGFLVAAANYRLAPEYQFPAMIEDVKCAVRYLRANAFVLGINPDAIGAWGGSAGGHLVSLLGVTDGDEGLEGNGGYPGVSSRVQAVVDMFGPTDLTVPFEGRGEDLMIAVFGTTDGSLPIFAIASPVTYITPDDPPFLILQGEEDQIVPSSQSQELYDLLQAAGVDSTLVVVANAGHGLAAQGGIVDPSKGEQIRMIVQFFDEHLK